MLLDAGIDVLTTMNVQHLESLNDQIWQSTGVRVRETIPDWVLKRADEVVMVDLTPGALLNRLARGVVYAPERAEAALQNFFKEPTLVALRELAMRQAAHVVESRLPSEDESSSPGFGSVPEPQGARAAADRHRPGSVECGVDPERPACRRLSAGRVPRGVRVQHSGFSRLARTERESLERHLNFARGLQIETRILDGTDVAETIVSFARLHGVTQVFIAREKPSALRSWFAAASAQRIVNLARDMQVTVVADRSTHRVAA